MDIKDKVPQEKDNPTGKLSPLRDAFHALANSMNGVNIIAYTYAFYINDLKENEASPAIKEEVLVKIAEIDAYYKKGEKGLKTISQMLDKPGVLKECKEFVSNVAKKLSEIGASIQNVKNTQGKIKDYCLKQELVGLAAELEKLPEQAQVAAGLAQDLKTKLVDMGKYYSL